MGQETSSVAENQPVGNWQGNFQLVALVQHSYVLPALGFVEQLDGKVCRLSCCCCCGL